MKVVGIDVEAGADLSLLDLRGLDFSGLNLARASFKGANLEGARFVGTILDGVNFQESNLAGVDFSGARFFDPDDDYDSDDFEASLQDFLDELSSEDFFGRLEKRFRQNDDDDEFDEREAVSDYLDEIIGRFVVVPRSDRFGKHWDLSDWVSEVRREFLEILTDAALISEQNLNFALLVSWRRTCVMVDTSAFLNDCSHDSSTTWPDSAHLADYPVFNQPPGRSWSTTGLNCPGTKNWGYGWKESFADRLDHFREWTPPEGYPRVTNPD